MLDINVLGNIIKQFMNEEKLNELGAGEELDAAENAAKERYEAAQADLVNWDTNEEKRQAFLAKATELGVTPDTARKRLKNNPRYNYDPKVSQKKRQTLLASLDKARDEYGAYEPSITGYKRQSSGGAKTAADKEMPEEGTHAFADVNDLKPLKWYSWSDPRWRSPVSKIAYGSSKEKSGEEQTGTGPGELRLATIFGGKMQGGGVSFDVVTPDGQQWEVKALETASTLIRPGTEGAAAYDRPRKRLDGIMKQMKNFNVLVKKLNLIDGAEASDASVIEFVDQFILTEYEMVVGKGEVSKDRIRALRAVLKTLATLRQKWTSQMGKAASNKTSVSLNDKKINVDKSTFIDIAKKLEKATGNKDVLSDFEERELALSALKDTAFDKPSTFFNEWYESIDVNRVFAQVDGVFIVNSMGFVKVPKSMFRRSFKFDSVSQGKPKFSFVDYGSGAGAGEPSVNV